MRLLHSTTLEFKVFHDENVTPYVILSHTWGEEEVSYQEMRFMQRLSALPDDLKQNSAFVATLEAAAGLDLSLNGRESIAERAGYNKIDRTSRIAREQELEYFWVDTCCIDKASSAELQEAINSMYKWYQQSTFCVVYLEDAKVAADRTQNDFYFHRALQESKWVTRGWTLQELIAPLVVAFYDQEWNYISDKHGVSVAISSVTRVPEYVLTTGDLSRSSVAQKMSWAAKRKTTRIEDRAYSLMGIFAVHIAMLYGEGDKAFRRLQEEIMRTSSDDSLFAWRALEGSVSGFRGLLADSPHEFQKSGHIVQPEHNRNSYTTLNLGLRIETHTPLVPMRGMNRKWDESLYFFTLDAEYKPGKKVALLLRQLEKFKYARVEAGSYWDRKTSYDNPTTLYIEHTTDSKAFQELCNALLPSETQHY